MILLAKCGYQMLSSVENRHQAIQLFCSSACNVLTLNARFVCAQNFNSSGISHFRNYTCRGVLNDVEDVKIWEAARYTHLVIRIHPAY